MFKLETLVDVVALVAASKRERAVLWQDASNHWHPISSHELMARVHYLANVFLAWGIAKGDRIALLAENRVLATPASPGSITTSGNKEDFVSMGMTAALKLKRIVRNTRAVLAIEALAAARALEFLRPLKTSVPLEIARTRICSVCAAFDGDHPLSNDIAALEQLIGDSKLSVASVS